MTGFVKKWIEDRGFGFITGQDGKDYFVHCSNIPGTGRKNLSVNANVEFDIETTPDGKNRAINVIEF